MMKLENSNLRVKGEKNRGQVLVQKEVLQVLGEKRSATAENRGDGLIHI